MNQASENLQAALQQGMKIRPKVGGFPHLAETLRRAGVQKNIWSLPACQSIYVTDAGHVVNQGTPLVSGFHGITNFDREALIRALRHDQAGKGTFPEFLESAWKAGVVRYEVDFKERKVTYFGCLEEAYVEEYPAIHLDT